MSDGSSGAQPRRDGSLPKRQCSVCRAAICSAPAGEGRLRAVRRASRPWMQRVALVLSLAAGFVLDASGEAPAFTLKLVFPDGRPMTFGSACSGDGCLQRGDRLEATNADGEVVLADEPGRTVEYRRDGIALSRVAPGAASGRVAAVGQRATVVLPRLLSGSAPAIDRAESDLVARLDEVRATVGLPSVRLDASLSAAADLQAT